MGMVLKLQFLCLLLCANHVSNVYTKGNASDYPEEPFLIGYVQKLEDSYAVNVHAPLKDESQRLDGFVDAAPRAPLGAEAPYMVADLTGERLCYVQTSELACIERLDSGKVTFPIFEVPSHSRIISINFPNSQYQSENYEVIYTSANDPKPVSLLMFDSKSNTSITIAQNISLSETKMAVDTKNWILFYEDVNHNQTWYFDLILGVKAPITLQNTSETKDGSHQVQTMAVDIGSGVFYSIGPESIFSWGYLPESKTSRELFAHENEPESHLSFSAGGRLFFTSRKNGTIFSLNSQNYSDWNQYYPRQGNSSIFGTAIQRSEKMPKETSCPRFCRFNETQKKCICWCPIERPLLTAQNECKPLVVVAARSEGTKLLVLSTQPTKDWDWLNGTEAEFGEKPFVYNALKQRLCGPKFNPEKNGTGVWCYSKEGGNVGWIHNDFHGPENPENALYPVNQAANTSDLYWMAAAENGTQCLWARENKVARNMKVYVTNPKHVAVDSFRQILFWCTANKGIVKLRWQAFNRTRETSNCFERQVSKATECQGLAVSEVRTTVYILSQDSIYHASYEELQKKAKIRKSQSLFSFSSDLPSGSLKNFMYNSGHLIWSRSSKSVTILKIRDENDKVSRTPVRVIKTDIPVEQIQVLVPHSEVVKSTDKCDGLSGNFAGICSSGNLTEASLEKSPDICTVEPPIEPTSTTQALDSTTESSTSPVSSTELVTSPSTSSLGTTGATTTMTSTLAMTLERSTSASDTTTPAPTPITAEAPKTTQAVTTKEAIPSVTNKSSECTSVSQSASTSSFTSSTTLQSTTPDVLHASFEAETTSATETAQTEKDETVETTTIFQRPTTETPTPTFTQTENVKPTTETSAVTEKVATTFKIQSPATKTSSSATENVKTTTKTQFTNTETTPKPNPVPTVPQATTTDTSTTKHTDFPLPIEPTIPKPPTVEINARIATANKDTSSKTTTAPEPPTKPNPPDPEPSDSFENSRPNPSPSGTKQAGPGPAGPNSSALNFVAITLGIIALICILSAIFVYRKYTHSKSQYANAISVFLNGSEALLESARDTAELALYAPFTSIITPNHLVIESFKRLREGAFSIACLGAHAGNEVVVETLKEGLDISTLKFLLHNLKLLAHIGQHNHIVEFFGAEISSIQTGVLRAVLEHSLQGSLTNVLAEMRRNLGSDNKTGASNRQEAVPNLVFWSSQIAQGLQHLWTKNIVHGSLSTRTVRVTDNNVKIALFGHVQTQYAQPTLGTSIKAVNEDNFRWAAPETLQRSEYSFKSDVWSYGVTLWEIFSFALLPFADHLGPFGGVPNFATQLALGQVRLEKPELMSDDVYNFILVPCCRTAPSDRSSVAQINDSWQQRLDKIK